MLLSIVLLAAAVPQAAPDGDVERLAALYDELCLKAFPDDAAVDAVMASKGAVPLTPEEVRVTFHDDPGRGWLLADGDREVQIMLELPPYHACSVRRFTVAKPGSLASYRAIADAYARSHPGFAPLKEREGDVGDIHVHSVGESRVLPDGTTETLYVFDQHINGPKGHANGETSVEFRFVHQIRDKGFAE
jgi:hypothetical protein